jgi:hypothetical protein
LVQQGWYSRYYRGIVAAEAVTVAATAAKVTAAAAVVAAVAAVVAVVAAAVAAGTAQTAAVRVPPVLMEYELIDINIVANF